MVVFLTKLFVFLFCLNFVSPWPTGYDENEFDTPLVDDVPSYFKGKKHLNSGIDTVAKKVRLAQIWPLV